MTLRGLVGKWPWNRGSFRESNSRRKTQSNYVFNNIANTNIKVMGLFFECTSIKINHDYWPQEEPVSNTPTMLNRLKLNDALAKERQSLDQILFCSHLGVCVWVLSGFSHVWLFVTPKTIESVHGILRQEYWSGLPCSPPEDFSHPGLKPTSLMPLHLGEVKWSRSVASDSRPHGL